MTPRVPRLIVLCALLLAASAPARSASPAKRPLRHTDYAGWRSVQGPALSPDGAFLAYTLAPQEGDGEFVARNLRTGAEHRFPTGSRAGGVVAAAARRPRAGAAGPAGGALFSPDGKYVAFAVNPPRADRTRGRAAGGPGVGVMRLADGKVTRLERVASFQMSEEGPAVLAYHRAAPAAAERGAAGATRPAGRGRAGAAAAGAQARPGTDLVLRRLDDGRERSFAGVTEYSLAKNGKWLVYAVLEGAEETGGVYAVDPGSETPPLVLRAGPGRCSRLTWDEKQGQLVFLHRLKPAKEGDRPVVRLCYWKPPAEGPAGPKAVSAAPMAVLARVPAALPRAATLTPAGKPAFEPGYDVTDQDAPAFSPDGSRVYFGVAAPPPPKPTPAPAGAAAEEKANVELWHYKDDFIQPMQKVRYTASRSYRAVFHLDDRTCRQLAGAQTPAVQTAPAGDWALATDDRPYRTLVGASESQPLADVYLLNSRTGARKPVVKKQASPATLSPAGKWVLCYDGKDWHTISAATGKRANLTAALGVSFADELNDTPGRPRAYGVAGWTKDDKHVLLYDRYDVWVAAADGSGAKNLTHGLGRRTTTQLRVQRLEAGREGGFDPAKALLLRAENERTRDTGFYRVGLDGGEPKLLIMGARNYGPPVKARKGDTLMLTVSTFYDFPDLYTADPDFREVRRVTNANPQKADLVWGKAQLVHYKNADGVKLSGVLIKPENFDPNRKYPLLVYIYERLSNNLHRFVNPQPGTSINPTFYASNGYLVLMPDIVYTVGYPGQSAVKCVLPAVQAVVDTGCVDEKAIGIQGHSWGGYQTAFLVTQTTRFKAAAAGAPVANMTSAYGGIRWESGLPRQFQYEKTQSRIGGTLWEAPTRYLDNSPLFQADRVKTPLLMLHNDNDGAVPWYQGIEYYLALRRLGKEVYLFNYRGEPHGLRRRVNQADYTVRMQQFFDHHLKGAAKPDWMVKGMPYTPPAGQEGATTPRQGGRRRQR